MRIAALAGGTGAAKLLRGLVATVDPAALTIIGNTGDDDEIWDLHVSPDLDSVMYALAGVLDTQRGWGRADETFHCLQTMESYGQTSWFKLGDADLATHLIRTDMLRRGMPLSRVVAQLVEVMNVEARILPATNDRVRTKIETSSGILDFQEFFVRERCQPEVRAVIYSGAQEARATAEALDAIRDSQAIIVAPLVNAGAPLLTAVISMILLGVVPGPMKIAGIVLALVAALLLALQPESPAAEARP